MIKKKIKHSICLKYKETYNYEYLEWYYDKKENEEILISFLNTILDFKIVFQTAKMYEWDKKELDSYWTIYYLVFSKNIFQV